MPKKQSLPSDTSPTLVGGTYLSLDLGMHTGFAYGNAHFLKGGSISFGSKYSGKTLDSLSGILCSFDGLVNAVAVEKTNKHMPGYSGVKVHFGMRGIVDLWAHRCGIPVYEYSATQIKKSWTGKGNAKKDEMVEAAIGSGFSPVDDNHADAIAIHHLHLKTTF